MKTMVGFYKLGEFYAAIYFSAPDKEFRISLIFYKQN